MLLFFYVIYEYTPSFFKDVFLLYEFGFQKLIGINGL